MQIVDPKVRKLLILNYTATFIIIIALFYTFYTFKQLHYFIVGIVGIFLMIISSCFQSYFCRVLIMQPYSTKIRNFIVLLFLMYLGVFLLILTITLNKSWNISFIFTIVLQILYSFISFFAIFKLIKNRPFRNRSANQASNDQDNSDQVSSAYSPGFQNDGEIFIPPDPFTNYDIETQHGSIQTNNSNYGSNNHVFLTDEGRNLTNGLHYPKSSPIIFSLDKDNLQSNNGNDELYKRTSSFYDEYGLSSNLDINTTGAISEYEGLYEQNHMIDNAQPACNPYANMNSENVI